MASEQRFILLNPDPRLLNPSSATYRDWVAQVTRLTDAVRQLDAAAREMGLPPAERFDWHGNLFQKLLPQLSEEPFLVVAVTGGTNTGKSVIFNHLAGGRISLTHPNATQTKHPVCCVPQSFAATHDLARVFADFQLRSWQSERDAVEEGPDNRLIVREDPHGTQPQRLLLLDTPDVDGTLKDNWRRAELVRHAADVLVCVLTQQKYNDAAIREFFRAAAAVDKTVLIVFNMVHWPRQAELCGGWLAQFRRETGIDPVHVYAAPWDPEAAEGGRLPFHPLSPGTSAPRADLAELQFDAIKIRSFRGSLRGVLDEASGLPAWLRTIESRAGEYAAAADILAGEVHLDRLDLPQFPPQLVWNEIWKWLDARRTPFDRWVHGAYHAVGSLVTRWFRGTRPDELAEFRQREWDRLRTALAELLDRLDRYRRAGNDVLKSELDRTMGTTDRRQLFDDFRSRYEAMPMITDGYRQFIHEQLDAFERENPRLIKGITWALVATAVARPAVSLGLGVVGAHGIDVAAGHLVVTWAGDFAIGAATAGVGEAVLVPTGQLSLRGLLNRLFERLYAERAKPLIETLHRMLIGPAIERIGYFAAVPKCEDFRVAIAAATELQQQLHNR